MSNNKRVVGLSYDENEPAPVVMLKAAGVDADALLDAAKSEDLTVVRDAALVDQLYRVPMDSPISRELFPVVALLLAHVLQIDQARQEQVHE
ncbi:MAG TPA: EscU/YscU/HrcU family type III secretion system export apparatus switch protein [Steroidobacteraceae bacterium]|nr:EscU/YscU/HrcU family type III secretion system export apparatus switch protein [Steroidobacteraceae bacterium]